MWALLALMMGLASAAELPDTPLERSPRWKRNNATAITGVTLGYAVGVFGMAGGAFEESGPERTAVYTAGAVGSAVATGLVFGGVGDNSRLLREAGVPVNTASQWTLLGLGGISAGSAVAVTAVEPSEPTLLIGLYQTGFAWNMAGVGMTQLLVNEDGMRRAQAPPSGEAIDPRFRRARNVAFVGTAAAWASNPLWQVGVLFLLSAGGEDAEFPVAAAPFLVGGILAHAVGTPMAMGGLARQRALLKRSGHTPYKAGLPVGMVLTPIAAGILLVESVGLPTGLFIPALGVHGAGMGLLSATFFIHERAWSAQPTAARLPSVVPYFDGDVRGVRVAGSF